MQTYNYWRLLSLFFMVSFFSIYIGVPRGIVRMGLLHFSFKFSLLFLIPIPIKFYGLSQLKNNLQNAVTAKLNLCKGMLGGRNGFE